jgi:internalin A
MRTTAIAASLPLLAMVVCSVACDENKYDKYLDGAASASAAVAVAVAPPSASVAAPPPAPTYKKKNAADCKPHPTTIDFGDDSGPALEAEVRFKLGKDAGAITPADLAQVKSVNLTKAQIRLHQIDPCIFPMFTATKGVFLPPGDYDDLTPLQKLTTIDALVIAMSQVKDLRPIEGLKRMDRLDISHTQVGDEEFKSVAQFVNLTELTMDETLITDISPVAKLTKLEKLSLKKSQVKSLAPLAALHTLKMVWIADTDISDITPVQPLIAGGMKLINK